MLEHHDRLQHNRSFLEADLFDTGGRQVTPKNYRMRESYDFSHAFSCLSLVCFLQTWEARITKGYTDIDSSLLICFY